MSSPALRTLLGKCLLRVPRVTQSVQFGSTYQAVVIKDSAGALQVEQQKRPKLKKDQVRLQVAYCSVNSSDVKGFSDATHKFPFVPGYELSGEVIEVGDTICDEDVKVGDRVAALNLETYGGLAEECVVNLYDIWRVPNSLSLKEAAVIPHGHSLALYTFGKLCPVNEKNTVIISVATGGLGLAAVDVAAGVYKTKVVAVTETEVQSDLTRDKGAFQTMHYHEKLRKDLTGVINSNGADVIYDAVGGKVLEEVSKCVKAGGRIFTVCPTLGKTIPTPPANSTLTVVNLLQLRSQDMDSYRQIVSDALEMAEEGIITTHISEKFDFKDVAKAIEYVKSKKCTGKVVVKMD